MRFEKLNENKIRITLTDQDLIKKHIDFHSFMANPIESQDLFLDILDTAEKEIGFVTKDYKIRIEAIQLAGGNFIFTVTRSMPEQKKYTENKKIHIKRKKVNLKENQAVYYFNSFDDFCSFSNFLKNNNIKISNIAKSVSLYEYKDRYYLSFYNINLNYEDLKKLFSVITEFGTYISNNDLIKRKLSEDGKVIMKNNAIKTAIEYFS